MKCTGRPCLLAAFETNGPRESNLLYFTRGYQHAEVHDVRRGSRRQGRRRHPRPLRGGHGVRVHRRQGRHVRLPRQGQRRDLLTSLGIKRNWAELSLEEIAPLDERDINVVPLGEAANVLALMKALIRDHYLTPSENDQTERAILNDFLPKGRRFANEKTFGHLWEFAYALAVELEHGRERGQNITMNHPLLTGMVVLAHLAEDRLYYARLLVMETEGELFNAQLKNTPYKELRASVQKLSWAQRQLGARKDEKLADA